MFWEAGPQRIHDAVAECCATTSSAGELAIADVPRAASQFLCLVKGELHAQLVFGCCDASPAHEVEAQLEGAGGHVPARLRAPAP